MSSWFFLELRTVPLSGLLSDILSGPVSERLASLWHSGTRTRRIFLMGSLVLLIAASATSDQLSYQSRVRSFSFSGRQASATRPSRAAAAELWAQNGFHANCTGVRCFHCGAQTDQLMGGQQDPMQVHSNLRPDCPLLRLLKILNRGGGGSVPDSDIASDSERFERLLNAISAGVSDPIARFVESFGFAPEAVAFAVMKLVVSTGGVGGQRARPGDLIDSIHRYPTSYHCIVHWLMSMLSCARKPRKPIDNVPYPMENRGNELSAADAASPSDSNQGTKSAQLHRQPAVAAPETQRHEAPAQQVEDLQDSPLCIACHRQTRNRILLPCAHFLLCDTCLIGCRACPRCRTSILSSIAAVIPS